MWIYYKKFRQNKCTFAWYVCATCTFKVFTWQKHLYIFLMFLFMSKWIPCWCHLANNDGISLCLVVPVLTPTAPQCWQFSWFWFIPVHVNYMFLRWLYTIDAEGDSKRVEGDSFKMVPTWCATGNTFSHAEHYWKWSPQWCSAMHDRSSRLVASKCTRTFMGETDRSFGSDGWIQSSSRETKKTSQG